MLRALGRSALLRVCSRRSSMFETLTFSWGPPREPGSPLHRDSAFVKEVIIS